MTLTKTRAGRYTTEYKGTDYKVEACMFSYYKNYNIIDCESGKEYTDENIPNLTEAKRFIKEISNG